MSEELSVDSFIRSRPPHRREAFLLVCCDQDGEANSTRINALVQVRIDVARVILDNAMMKGNQAAGGVGKRG